MKFDDLFSPAATRRPRWVLRGAAAFFLLATLWAAFSEVDQVTHAQGQVIASARTQVMQSPDGGVLREILVREGDRVTQDQRIAVMERDRAEAAFADSKAKVAALRITLTRLRAEVFGKPLEFDKALLDYPEFIANQKELYLKRRRAIDEDTRIVTRALVLAREELAMSERLEKTGDVGRAELLRLQRQIVDLEGQLESRRNKYFQDSQAELTKAEEDLSTQEQGLAEREALLDHTELRAPTDGIVKNIRVTTLGGVLRPGDVLMEILPTNSDLVVEVKLPPAEAGFIKVGLPATVKLDAYDYSIYGSLDGEVAYLSADTLSDQTREGEQIYYRVRVKIVDSGASQMKVRDLAIVPGMTVAVDIRTGQRSVLSFLTKPITKTLLESFSER